MIQTNSKAKEITLSATITRANGRVEHIGVIAYYHRNPFRRFVGNSLIWLKRKVTNT